MDQLDCVVIGAGVVGLACARALALCGREVVILESEDSFGTGISSRNSEVIHAGIYYIAGSLKARLCVSGRRVLYAYLDRAGVSYQRCGKLIVATSRDELPLLARIESHALENGVEDLRRLEQSEALHLEPALNCVGALCSAQTGIVDTHGLMLAYLGEAEAHGAMLVTRSRVERGALRDDGIMLQLASGERFLARSVVNSAGLSAQSLMRAVEGYPQEQLPPLYLAKGNYFSCAGAPKFTHLIYPIPESGGLGSHLTFDLGGRVRFGPDVEWVDREEYSVDPRRVEKFYIAVRRYWPSLPDGALEPDYAGIRPKIVARGLPDADFRIDGPERHGVPGLVNLFGIESPGLTASLMIADEVVARLRL